MNKLYLKVTNDRLQLPLLICDSLDELSDKTGISKNTLLSSIYRNVRLGSITGFSRADYDEDIESEVEEEYNG